MHFLKTSLPRNMALPLPPSVALSVIKLGRHPDGTTESLKSLCFIIAIIIFPVIVFSAQYKCTRVTDGDTITVTQNGFKTTIRLVGIDAPEKSRKKHEPGQPFSQASTKYLAGMVLNKNVDIVSYGNDRYGRTLGVVYVDGKNVNLEMVKAGLS